LKKLPSKVIKRIKEGKNVAIDKCIRQPQSTRIDQHLASIGPLTLSTSSTKARTVTKSTDWLEAFLSSFLPILLAQASEATTLDACKARVAQIEKHVSYCLAALVYYQRFDFQTVKNYLESHREQCYAHSTDISEPNIPMFNSMQRSTQSSSSSASSSSSSASNGSSSQVANTRNNSRTRNNNRSSSYTAEQCGKFNSFDGCHDSNCKVKHACKLCKSEAHGKTKCPSFKKK
jgi:hypothetical protein